MASAILFTSYIIFVIIRPDKMMGATSGWLVAYYAVFTTFLVISIYSYFTLGTKYKKLYHA